MQSDSDYQPYAHYGQEVEENGQFEAAYRSALQPVWAATKQEISQCGTDMTEYKNQQLPLARIKKIMKSDEDVRMISAEAPVLFAKACEMFILDLTIRGWVHAEDNRRRTLQRSDIAACIAQWEILDFLTDIIPLEEAKPEGAAAAAGAGEGMVPSTSAAAVAAAAAAAAEGAIVPQQSAGGVYYAPGITYPPMALPGPVDDQTAAATAVASPTVPLGDAPVEMAMFQQWSAEGQAQAAAVAAVQGSVQEQ